MHAGASAKQLLLSFSASTLPAPQPALHLPPAPPQLRCLSAFGGTIPTAPRRQIGRCLVVNGTAYTLNASSPEDRWDEVGPLLRAVVATFRK